MAFKPNYRQQRNERARGKQAKAEEKLRLQQEQVARRKAAQQSDSPDEGGAAPEPSDDPSDQKG